MQDILERLLLAADNHGEDAGEPDHTVGDLQDLLRRAWSLMSEEQRRAFIQSEEVGTLVELGARGEFDQDDLLADLEG